MAGRRRFTIKLCSRLAAQLRDAAGSGFEVVEDVAPFDDWLGRPDIYVRRPGGKSVLIVEVEHWSGQAQAVTNMRQALAWARLHPDAGVAFVHCVNTEGNVDVDALWDADADMDNWSYEQIQYEHEREDADSGVDAILSQIISGSNAGVLLHGFDFAMNHRATRTTARKEARPRGPDGFHIRRETDDYDRPIWAVYAHGRRQGYFMSEAKARSRLRRLQDLE